MPVTTAEAQSRMEAKLAELARAGVKRVLLYGAGRHTLKVGEVLGEAPVEIVGIVDDHRGGQSERLWNWPILTRDEAAATGAEAVIISSDAIEQRMHDAHGAWFASKGMAVHRLYGPDSGDRAEGDGTFTDSTGKTHVRIPGYRRRVRPSWEKMLANPPGQFPVPTPQQARAAMQAALKRVELLEKYLQLAGFSIRDRDVLEIGCWDGACTFALASAGCRRAVGIDHQDYFLWNVEPEQITDPLRAAARESLLGLQAATRRAATELGLTEAGSDGGPRAELLIDDINDCRLPDASFDVICSWQTLEHLVPLDAAFAAMTRLLRPGGVCFHEYGAFTCRKGGHALCTLDFPWGHVRLGEADVERYLTQFRPDESAHAIRHYRRFLNRLLPADVVRLADAAGLKVVQQTVWLNRQQFEDELVPEYVEDACRQYPDITFEDLIHDDVWLVLEKPAPGAEPTGGRER